MSQHLQAVGWAGCQGPRLVQEPLAPPHEPRQSRARPLSAASPRSSSLSPITHSPEGGGCSPPASPAALPAQRWPRPPKLPKRGCGTQTSLARAKPAPPASSCCPARGRTPPRGGDITPPLPASLAQPWHGNEVIILHYPSYPSYPSYPLLALGIGSGTGQHRDGDAGDTQPLGGGSARGCGQDEGSAVVSSPHGSKLWAAAPGVPPASPHGSAPHGLAPRAALPARRTVPAPLQHAASSACVTALPAQSAGAAACPRPGLASATSSPPPQLLANPARGSRSRGVTLGSHGTATSRGSGTVSALANRKKGSRVALGTSLLPVRPCPCPITLPGLGMGRGHRVPSRPNPPWRSEGAGWISSLRGWRAEGPEQAQGHPQRDFSHPVG